MVKILKLKNFCGGRLEVRGSRFMYQHTRDPVLFSLASEGIVHMWCTDIHTFRKILIHIK